jgi:hypothetical protein
MAAQARVCSIVKLKLVPGTRHNEFTPAVADDSPQTALNFTNFGVMFYKDGTNKTVEQHLADAGMVVQMADGNPTHAVPIFPVKRDEQATNSQLFAVYQVPHSARSTSSSCRVTLSVRL